MKKYLVLLFALVLLVGCKSDPTSPVFSAIQLLGKFQAVQDKEGFNFEQDFIKPEALEIEIHTRDKETEKTFFIFKYDGYGTSGTFKEKITILFDAKATYQARLKIGFLSSPWVDIKKMIGENKQ